MIYSVGTLNFLNVDITMSALTGLLYFNSSEAIFDFNCSSVRVLGDCSVVGVGEVVAAGIMFFDK